MATERNEVTKQTDKEELTMAEKDFADWLDDNLHRMRMRKSALADYMGVSRQSVTNWINRAKISREHLVKLEALFGSRSPLTAASVSEAQLIRASMQLKPDQSPRDYDVPLINWNDVELFADVPTLHQKVRNQQDRNWTNCFNLIQGRTVAFIARNDAMSPVIDAGETLFVSTDRVPQSSDIVVAYTKGDQEAVVRRYISENGREHLVATNRDWVTPHVEITSENTTIVGVVLSKVKKFV